jgi:signal transduction histidine kinase
MAQATDPARNAFEALRYWQTDLAVSMLMQSERNASLSRVQLRADLTRLAAKRPGAIETLRKEITAYDDTAQKAVDAYTSDQRIIGNSLFGQARGHVVAVEAQFASLIADIDREAAAVRAAVRHDASRTTAVSLSVLVCAVAAGLTLTLVVLRSILGPLRRLVASIEAITAGDLSVPLPPVSSDEIGSMTRALSLFRDTLNARHRLERAQEHQRRTIADAIECISDGFVLYGSDDTLVLSNTRFSEQHPGLEDQITPGRSREAIIRAAIARRLIDIAPLSPDNWVEHLIHGPPASALEYRAGRKWLRSSARPTHDGGRVVIVTDITDLKSRQTELEQAREEAERATRMKTEFLANMSHELRTPLNAIIGYSQILQEDAADLGLAAFGGELAKIERAGNHLLGLINAILDLSKIEAGRMELHVEPVRVADLIDAVRSMVETAVANNANTLTVRRDPAIGRIMTDEVKLKQCLLNLLSNAAKFTRDGEITLDVSVQETAAGRFVRFEVRDTGIGISPQQLPRLFEPFTQADGSTTRQYGGTGLGLAITRSFARLLGGNTTVRSEPGRGSCFTISLPLTSVADAAPETADQDGAGGAVPPGEM